MSLKKEHLEKLIPDFVRGTLDASLREVVREALKVDRDLAMVYAREIRSCLDSGTIDMPVIPERETPHTVNEALLDQETGWADLIRNALSRAATSIENRGVADRIENWLARAKEFAKEFEKSEPAFACGRGDLSVVLKHFSDRGVFAVADIKEDNSSLTATIRPTFESTFLVMLVPMISEMPPVIREVTNVDAYNNNNKIKFEHLPAGTYVVSVEPSRNRK